MNRSWNFRRGVLLALAGYTAFLVFAAPQRCADALQAGLRLCGGPLLVSLFPFLIVSALAAGCGAGQWLGFVFRPAARLMGIRAKGAGGVLLIGALGGFAPAAVAASEAVRTGQLTSRQASALLPACVCSGPSFVILTVGQQMLGSRAVGVRLFAAQLLAGYLTAALLCRMQGGAGQAPPAQGETIQLPALDAVIAQAAVTYLKLCGFVLYFRLLAAGCGALLPQPWAALPAMLLEVCSGCDQAARTGLWASTLCCAALSVQGVSVLLQVRTICPAEISLRPLLAARAVHLPLSVALFWLGSTVPVQAVQTFTTLTERVVVLRRVPLDCALLAFAVCCITVEELARVEDRAGLWAGSFLREQSTGVRHPAAASLSLASCWPRPQQQLPVSAAGGNRSLPLQDSQSSAPQALARRWAPHPQDYSLEKAPSPQPCGFRELYQVLL